MTKGQKVVMIGAGNVATQLGLALQESGFSIVQVYSRSLESAEILGRRLGTSYTHDCKTVNPDADWVIFAVKDSALPELLDELPPFGGILIHTAGSIPMDIFAGYSERYGVLYPLQTFSKNRKVSFSSIPIFIEAHRPEDEFLLKQFAQTLSSCVTTLASEKRKQLHLAAVFACNFTNHLYTLAAQLLEANDLSFDLLRPLIQETAAKINDLHPQAAQTGPAVRYDESIISQHLEMMKDNPPLQEIYRLLSTNIYQTSSR
jgi:predicted short-subunit dehydrogenase-like oxidoreductase (DUF2520 family)